MKSLTPKKLFNLLFWLIQCSTFKFSKDWNEKLTVPNDGMVRVPLINPAVIHAINKVIYLPNFQVRLAFFVGMDEKPNPDDVHIEVYSTEGKLIHSNDIQHYSELTHLAVEVELYHRLLTDRNLYIPQL